MSGSEGADVRSMLHQTLLGDAWDHAEVALAVFSDDGRYIACNAAFCSLTGFSRDEIMAMRVAVDLAPERSRNVALFREIVSGRAKTGSGQLRRKDGTVLTVDVLAIATRVASLPYFVVLYWEQSARPRWASDQSTASRSTTKTSGSCGAITPPAPRAP